MDVFIHYLDSDELARADDRQIPICGVVQDFLKYVSWDNDGFARKGGVPARTRAVCRAVMLGVSGG